MPKNDNGNGSGEIEAIQRTLRDITRIQDGAITKILKSVLERQARIWARIEKLEERVARVAKGNAA